MSDLELITKAAHRIYPTHLKEHEKGSSFSWSGVLPTDAKLRLGDSEGHKQTSDRNSETLTHKLKGGASIEFNIIKNGKNNIAMTKYHKGGKLFTAIHSHEDPLKAMTTAYHAVAGRIIKEEAEVALIEKMEKRIEKKTGKISDKKEKIDVEPSEEKELKESTPPGMENWVKKNKAHFIKEYGEKKGHEVLYATAWKLHNKMDEMEELNELSKKTLASYVKKSNHSSFELGYDAASNEFHDDGDYKKTQKDEKKALKRQRFVSKAIDKLAEAEYPTDTKQGILAQLDYHHGRENYHRQSAEMNHRKANKHALGSENYKLYKNVAKGQEAIAKHHHNRIQDLHKKFATINESEGKVEMMYLSKGFISPKLAEKLARESKHLGTDKSTGEQHYLHPQHGRMVLVPHKSGEFQFRLAEDVEQLDELSPHTLGRYIKFAAIDKSKRAAHGAISDMAMYNAQNRGDKKDAQREKELGDVHRKKEDKRTLGILKATDKLVRKAHGLHEASRSVPHPDKVVMTSSIRKDLGSGYMAKTRNGHFYKLDVNALGEPGKGRKLPNLGTVLDTSKHKFIGKDKVDLNLLKESERNVYSDLQSWKDSIKRLGYKHKLTTKGKDNHHYEAYKNNEIVGFFNDNQSDKSQRKHGGVLTEDLDHDHPDMKAYHAACKACDEAHLASIRYRMNHDIKQPDHRAKYDELEAEHHRLRDIEDAAGEKVNGRLFAHHVTKK